jgi:hypothetical protein
MAHVNFLNFLYLSSKAYPDQHNHPWMLITPYGITNCVDRAEFDPIGLLVVARYCTLPGYRYCTMNFHEMRKPYHERENGTDRT